MEALSTKKDLQINIVYMVLSASFTFKTVIPLSLWVLRFQQITVTVTSLKRVLTVGFILV